MRINFEGIRKNCILHKFGAIVVAFATLLAMVMVGGVAAGNAHADGSHHSLNQHILSVTLKKAPQGSENWTDFNGILEENERLKVTFTFEISKGTLGTDEASRTFVYDSPVGITSSDATKDHPGTFPSIGAKYYFEGDKIHVVFDEETAKENVDHPITKGTFNFESDCSHVENTGKTEFDFGNGNKQTIKVNHRGDLTVQKTHAEPSTDGTVSWTVTVHSNSGTKPDENINITDVPSLGTIDLKSIRVSGGNCTSNPSDNGFAMSCPALSENGTYTITYISKVDVKDGETTYQKNDVTVKAKDKNGNTIDKTVSGDVSWDKKPTINKKEGVLSENGTATWAVTVDASKLDDLNGWKLEDQVTDGILVGNITSDKPVNGHTSFASFPIVFGANDKKTTYTFTYTTKPNNGIGATMVKNRAELTPPNGGNSVNTGDKGVAPGAFNPLNKTHGTVTPSTDGKTVTVPWTVTIAPKNAAEALPAGWSHTDSLSYNQYFTDSQCSELKTAIEAAFKKADLSAPTIDFTKNGEKVTGFTIKSPDALLVRQSIMFSYNATGEIRETWNGEQDYSNTVNTSGFTKSDSVKYTPSNLKWTLKKVDAKTNTDADSTHEYNDLNSMEQIDGKPVMHWQIQVDQAENVTDTNGYTDLTITERMPKGVTLNGLGISINGGNSACNTNLNIPAVGDTVQSSCSWTVYPNTESGTISVTQNNNGTFAITVPGELMKKLRTVTYYDSQKISIRLDVRATIDDASKLGKTATVFKNTAKLNDASGKDWGEKSQSQKITKDDEWNVIHKATSYNPSDNSNLVPYSIVVNPNALDLDKNSDTITLEDSFSYPYNENQPVEFSLNEVKVYLYDATKTDFKGTELPKNGYTVTPSGSSDGNTRINKLKLSIPDSTALVVDYSYRAVGDANTEVEVSNNASLHGKTSGVDGTSVKVVSSHGDATISKLTFTKADSNDPTETLQGAKFDLYQWNTTDRRWDKLFSGLKTDENGQLEFSASTTETTSCSENQRTACNSSVAHVRFNMAYKLVETQAPDGYDTPTETAAEHYFMLRDNDKDVEAQFPLSKPDTFPVDAIHNSGYTGFILNSRSKASLPSAGGSGDSWFVAGGALTVLVASFGLAETRKNAKRMTPTRR